MLILLLLVGFVAGISKPNESDLRNALIEKHTLVYGAGVLAEKIGILQFRYHNYIVFSSLSVQIGFEPERTVAFGLFGKVFVPPNSELPKREQPLVPTSKTNANEDLTPPSQAQTNTAQNTPQIVQNCVIYNASGGMVKLRRDCDTKNCEQDPTTMYTEVADGTALGLLNLNSYNSGRFTWRPVSYNGEVLWVSAAKLSCF